MRAWLTTVFLFIVAMTAVGGITRLTGSGLSMVEWQPLIGAVPPLTEAHWVEVFEKYQQTPQYLLVNDWMQLADFKRIFFWEYIHRLIGRSIGLVVFVPWLWFLVRRRMPRRLAWQTVVMLLLGGSQGLLGWYMVQSGLVDVPRVSHLRLAAHLLLAFTVAQYVLWVRLGLDPSRADARRLGRGTAAAVAALGLLVFVQSAWGAFMAGTHAGHFASTFPDVNGHWLPTAFIGERGLIDAVVYEVGAIHAMHRLLGWIVLVAGGAVAWLLLRDGAPQVRRLSTVVAGLVALQFTLGALTVVFHVPTWLAVSHQVVALLLLSACTAAWQRGYNARVPTTKDVLEST